MEKTLSRLICKIEGNEPNIGELEGTCCICGNKTNKGHKKKFGANFTAAPEVSAGDVICEYCIHLLKNSNSLRRSMWIVTEHEFKKFKKAEAKDVVLNLPDEPFILYLTNTWQKIGWVKLGTRLNLSNKKVICTVDYDTYFVDVGVIKELFKFIEGLRELKIRKQELERGELSIFNLKKIGDIKKAREISKRLKKYAQNPIWNLCVYLNE